APVHRGRAAPRRRHDRRGAGRRRARGEGGRVSPAVTFVATHLARTSRTFALAVPTLPPRLGHAVGLAYLLFRVADTLEDASRWDAGMRVAALHRFAALLERPDTAAAAEL